MVKPKKNTLNKHKGKNSLCFRHSGQHSEKKKNTTEQAPGVEKIVKEALPTLSLSHESRWW